MSNVECRIKRQEMLVTAVTASVRISELVRNADDELPVGDGGKART
jgi:hypothetical protein